MKILLSFFAINWLLMLAVSSQNNTIHYSTHRHTAMPRCRMTIGNEVFQYFEEHEDALTIYTRKGANRYRHFITDQGRIDWSQQLLPDTSLALKIINNQLHTINHLQQIISIKPLPYATDIFHPAGGVVAAQIVGNQYVFLNQKAPNFSIPGYFQVFKTDTNFHLIATSIPLGFGPGMASLSNFIHIGDHIGLSFDYTAGQNIGYDVFHLMNANLEISMSNSNSFHAAGTPAAPNDVQVYNNQVFSHLKVVKSGSDLWRQTFYYKISNGEVRLLNTRKRLLSTPNTNGTQHYIRDYTFISNISEQSQTTATSHLETPNNPDYCPTYNALNPYCAFDTLRMKDEKNQTVSFAETWSDVDFGQYEGIVCLSGRFYLIQQDNANIALWDVACQKDSMGLKPWSVDERQYRNDASLLFPNPGKGQVNLKQPFMVHEIRVFHPTGQVAFHQIIENNVSNDLLDIDLSHLKPGMYIIQLVSDKDTPHSTCHRYFKQ